MPRKRHARILDEAPLVFTLGQVIFSPVLAIGNYINDIQENLRKNGFPKVSANTQRTIKVEEGGIFPTMEEMPSWVFLNKEDTIGITLTNNFITFYTTDYKSFDDLVAIFRTALGILKKIVGIELIQRVGLRYVDLIRIKEGESFSDYLQNHLLGFKFDNVDANKTDCLIQSAAQTQCGKLIVRCMRTNAGLPLPPDLTPLNLKLVPANQPPAGEWVTFLDFDHFEESQRDFVVDEIIDCFWNLHEVTGDAFFNNAITTIAKERWKLRVKQ